MLSCQGNEREEPEACHKEEVDFFYKIYKTYCWENSIKNCKRRKPFIQLTLEEGSLAQNR